ncbi:alkyl/aryl-sulfatase [Cupriavidus sp. MP-37]|uniref:alkyl/aryl-sulfatase n=1 Tax=Cupriavidus sp. MP-37 TaxID=2884455 RepID=UPI001D0AE4A5|nr:alkyl sulfatase dimerization domain-containing protein [Cupriavidus sp. MP-37]UDM49614.1 MBL fold metallo-hydrolase [Cupriavidus sp. MP-37]
MTGNSLSPDAARPKPAHPITARLNASVRQALDFQDNQDFDDAHRGFIGTLDEPVIRNAQGEIVWNQSQYDFLEREEAPDSVNPSLWRMARLNHVHGLFRVTERIYQVRGFDLANITFVETDHGLIVIDPLTFEEAASAALGLYTRHRGKRDILAVCYSHSHRDHYGGVRGVVSEADVKAGRVQIIAPDKFMEEAISEAVVAGVPMRRRAAFQFGTGLPAGIFSHVDSGLGKAVGRGTYGLIPPTRVIRQSGERMVIDGVEIEFQLTPGTEAPSEMNVFFPTLRALNMAENACHTMHNLCPLRGAKIRDALAWARYLDESIERYADKVDVVYAQHHWPVWGTQRVSTFLSEQRDLYRYLHDQTLRWMSHGLTAPEIAEKLFFPDEISMKWHTRGYYGAVAHNVQAIYAWYMGPYDGNPANLHPLPPTEAGMKYVEYMGGIDAIMPRAREDFERGEFRWVAQLMNHAVFADPSHRDARELGADAFEQLAYQAESATWRNAYVLAARELRQGKPRRAVSGNIVSAGMIGQLPIPLLLDYIAIHLKGPQLAPLKGRIDWQMTDEDAAHRLTLSHGALNHRPGSHGDRANAVLRTNRVGLARAFAGGGNLLEALEQGCFDVEGDKELVRALFAGLDTFDAVFAVVEP